LRKRLYAVAFSILLVGLSAGLVIYAMADEEPDALQEIYGSKTYVRQLQRFGGRASVVFDDVNRWLAARFRGKSLGATIVWLSAAAALGVALVARRYKD